VLLFADGCIDKSAEVSHSLLLGPRHYVVSCNDLHEISNYRLAVKYAEFFGCKYLVLLQDDDIYDSNQICKWLEDALELFAVQRCSIIGGNGAAQIDPSFEYKFADSSIQSAEFISGRTEDGLRFHQLGNIERWIEPVLGNRPDDNKFGFAASVNRAPQIIDAKVAKDLDFFPKALEPYQYDDYWNCFSSWMSDYSVVWMPIKGKLSNGSGGMRLYNNVKLNSRPTFFAQNWNFFLNNYIDSFDVISRKVREANEGM